MNTVPHTCDAFSVLTLYMTAFMALTHAFVDVLQPLLPTTASDVWALGVLLWEVAYLKHPFFTTRQEWWQVLQFARHDSHVTSVTGHLSQRVTSMCPAALCAWHLVLCVSRDCVCCAYAPCIGMVMEGCHAFPCDCQTLYLLPVICSLV